MSECGCGPSPAVALDRVALPEVAASGCGGCAGACSCGKVSAASPGVREVLSRGAHPDHPQRLAHETTGDVIRQYALEYDVSPSKSSEFACGTRDPVVTIEPSSGRLSAAGNLRARGPAKGGNHVLLFAPPLGAIVLDSDEHVTVQLHRKASFRAKAEHAGVVMRAAVVDPPRRPTALADGAARRLSHRVARQRTSMATASGVHVDTAPGMNGRAQNVSPASHSPRPGSVRSVQASGASGPPPPPADKWVSPVAGELLGANVKGIAGTTGGAASCTAGAGLFPSFEVRCGDATFCIEWEWYNRYVERGRASDATYTMDQLFGVQLYDATVYAGEVRSGLIDCWNIDLDMVDTKSGLVFDAFFGEIGGPRQFVVLAMGMVFQYTEFIKDEWTSGASYCTGLSSFLATLGGGFSAANRKGRKCKLSVNAVSTDSRFASKVNICDEETRTCADSREAGTAIFDSFLPVFEETRDARGNPRMLWFCEVDGKNQDSPLGFNGANGYSAPDAGTAVFFAADEVAYDGFLADWIMYWARVAMDYCFDRESEAHLDQAEIMARMVLALLA